MDDPAVSSEGNASLPWGALKHTTGEIPWPALEALADAAAADPSVAEQLRSRYEEIVTSSDPPLDYEYVYIPAIFALAAPKLTDAERERTGEFLVKELLSAGEADDDILLEVMEASCGALGPGVLPIVLRTLEDVDERHSAWFHLWGVTTAAAASDDPALRERVARRCMDALEQAERGEMSALCAAGAAWTLAEMGYSQGRPLLERLYDKTGFADLLEAIEMMDRGDNLPREIELWTQPVREWLPPRWERLRREYEDEGDEDEDDGEEDEESETGALIDAFLGSREADALPERSLGSAGFIVQVLLQYAEEQAGVGPEEFDRENLEKLLLKVFPRKVSAEKDTFEAVAPVVAAFVRWLGSQGKLANAARLAAAVESWHRRIVANAMDPRNWGMAKGFVMRAQAEGVDTGDKAEFHAFVERYNRQIAGKHVGDSRGAVGRGDVGEGNDAEDDMPTPTAQSKPSVGRNDPCPCGSGKKFKKCCGR